MCGDELPGERKEEELLQCVRVHGCMYRPRQGMVDSGGAGRRRGRRRDKLYV